MMKLKLLLATLAISAGLLTGIGTLYNNYAVDSVSSIDENLDDEMDDDFSFFGFWTGKSAKAAAKETIIDQLVDQFSRIAETGELY